MILRRPRRAGRDVVRGPHHRHACPGVEEPEQQSVEERRSHARKGDDDRRIQDEAQRLSDDARAEGVVPAQSGDEDRARKHHERPPEDRARRGMRLTEPSRRAMRNPKAQAPSATTMSRSLRVDVRAAEGESLVRRWEEQLQRERHPEQEYPTTLGQRQRREDPEQRDERDGKTCGRAHLHQCEGGDDVEGAGTDEQRRRDGQRSQVSNRCILLAVAVHHDAGDLCIDQLEATQCLHHRPTMTGRARHEHDLDVELRGDALCVGGGQHRSRVDDDEIVLRGAASVSTSTIRGDAETSLSRGRRHGLR